MHLLLVSPADSVDDVVPGLALLPAHRTTLVPVAAGGLLAALDDVDAVLLDGRDRPRAAGELAAAVTRSRPGLPRLLVLGPDADLPTDAEEALEGLLLTDAGPAEIELRLRLAARAVPPPARPAPATSPAPLSGDALAVGDLVVDTASFQARVADRPLTLARREFELLSELVEHAGRPLSRRHLLATVWGRDYEGSARTVDVHVKQLRRVLGAGHRDMIRTVRGTGYVLVTGLAPAAPSRVGGTVPSLARPLTAHRPAHRTARPGGRDTPGDVVASKRAGLPLDLAALAGAGGLGALERYSLKTLGVCSQASEQHFLVRARTRGALGADAARALADLARHHSDGRVHLTTRQQVELHDVPAPEIPEVLGRLRDAGLDTESTCGHTIRGVTSCPDAGVSADEPFDCTADAAQLTDSLLALGPDLNARLPQRLTIGVGGCARCRDQAKVSDIGLVSTLDDDGRLGYELWAGGSLGRSSPTLASRIVDFLPRERMLPAVHAVLAVFLAHGAYETPNRGRLKFLVARLGLARFTALVAEAERATSRRPWPAPAPLAPRPVTTTPRTAPDGGWGTDVRPQTRAGLATVTVTVPLGELSADALDVLAAVGEADGDGTLRPSRDQNVVLRDVPVGRVAALRDTLADVGLLVGAEHPARDVRSCVGAPVCALAITPTHDLARTLWDLPALRRNSGLRVSLSGCPASCTRHQAADLGLAGNLVSIHGRRVAGYRVHLGGDLGRDRLGRVLGRVAADHVPALVEAVVGAWEEHRIGHESLADTIARTGVGVVVSALRGLPALAWAAGGDDADDAGDARALPLAVAQRAEGPAAS
ncbi:winged helix-turn-helix domain-containing protein [Actinomycetospora sp.]|uniref:winged helix-turn-helix domain-containing protein n=1 Tax=Actinomycetospora sp. TaxID=1872135 RepID=UPI002F42713F